MNTDEGLQPHRPQQTSEYAEACLLALSAQGLGRKISLGGAFGLAHYYEYRPTHDVDAWWMPEATTEERQQVVQALQDALRPFGLVRVRMWGDVVSVELRQKERAVFSFQVAHRSAQLAPPQSVPWTDAWLDSFPDLVAAKMVALVERGAPRDFRDIYTLCQAGVMTAEQCWALWRQRQQLAGSDTDAARARLAIQTHLARIALHRPLKQIADPTERAAAEQVRTWFEKEFLNVLVD
jgi:hypothetical protein